MKVPILNGEGGREGEERERGEEDEEKRWRKGGEEDKERFQA